MSTISALFPNSPIKSNQTGYVSTTTITTATGEDLRYIDVTISPVVVAKCDVRFEGTGATGTTNAGSIVPSAGFTSVISSRLTSTTNLRLSGFSAAVNPGQISGRWKVVEYN